MGRLNFAQARTNIVQSALGTVGIDNMSLARSIAARFHELRTQMIHPLPGAIDTLTFFKQAGVPMVLVTNGDAAGQRQKIQRFHLESYFKGILIEEECGFGKPDQRIYRRALRVLGLEPQAVWMVGDNLEWEVIAPARLGIPGIWVDYRGQGLPDHCPTEPLMVVSCLADLIQ